MRFDQGRRDTGRLVFAQNGYGGAGNDAIAEAATIPIAMTYGLALHGAPAEYVGKTIPVVLEALLAIASPA